MLKSSKNNKELWLQDKATMIMPYAKKPTLMIPTPAGCSHLSIKLLRTIINFIIQYHKQIFLLGGSNYFIWDRDLSAIQNILQMLTRKKFHQK